MIQRFHLEKDKHFKNTTKYVFFLILLTHFVEVIPTTFVNPVYKYLIVQATNFNKSYPN